MDGLLFAKSATIASVAILELWDAAFTDISESTLNGVTILVLKMDVITNALAILGNFILLTSFILKLIYKNCA
ncbi:hypothetical protein PROCOU_07238 [Listeria rocourtiae FSL F6-920]|nr:hypothetical protein PROCOU_07238 [Listeria rocourtiae FSL F6-920]